MSHISGEGRVVERDWHEVGPRGQVFTVQKCFSTLSVTGHYDVIGCTSDSVY